MVPQVSLCFVMKSNFTVKKIFKKYLFRQGSDYCHTEIKIECFREPNKPEKLDHEWIQVELISQDNQMKENTTVIKKETNWDNVKAVLGKMLWIPEDQTYGENLKTNLIKRTEQLVKGIQGEVEGNTIEKEVQILSKMERRKIKIKLN